MPGAPARGGGLDAVADRRAGRVSAHLPARDQTAAFRRRDQRLVRRSDDEERFLQIRPDELSRAAPFLRSLPLADAARDGTSGRCVCRWCSRASIALLADAEIRAIRRTQDQSTGCARDGGLARFRFLRPLLDPRSLDAALLDAFHPRRARTLEDRHARNTSGAPAWASSG